MKIKLIGFELTQGAVNLDDFFEHIAKKNGKEHKYGYAQRILYLAENKKFHLGLLLTAKANRRICELAKSGSGFSISVRELLIDSRLVDFNFFVVRKSTGRGIFQYYWGSASLSSFGGLLHKHYRELSDLRKGEALAAAGGDAAPKSKQKEIREKFRQPLNCFPLYTEDDFSRLVQNLSKISSVTFSFAKLATNESWFTPDSDAVTREKRTFSFSKDGSVRSIAKAVIAAVRHKDSAKFDDASVYGLDLTSGQDVVYNLSENIDSLATLEFDEVANDKTLSIPDIEKSTFFETMLRIAGENPVMFERRVKA